MYDDLKDPNNLIEKAEKLPDGRLDWRDPNMPVTSFGHVRSSVETHLTAKRNMEIHARWLREYALMMKSEETLSHPRTSLGFGTSFSHVWAESAYRRHWKNDPSYDWAKTTKKKKQERMMKPVIWNAGKVEEKVVETPPEPQNPTQPVILTPRLKRIQMLFLEIKKRLVDEK